MKSKWRLSWGRHSWLEFISSPLRWSLNTSVEMLITERDASRYCRNTHTHTHWELSISELLIQKIWRYKSRAVNKPDLSIVIEPWPKPVTLPRIWGDERLSGCLLNMRADARRRVHLCCCLFLLMPCVTLRWISIKSKPWNEHILFLHWVLLILNRWEQNLHVVLILMKILADESGLASTTWLHKERDTQWETDDAHFVFRCFWLFSVNDVWNQVPWLSCTTRKFVKCKCEVSAGLCRALLTVNLFMDGGINIVEFHLRPSVKQSILLEMFSSVHTGVSELEWQLSSSSRTSHCHSVQ